MMLIAPSALIVFASVFSAVAPSFVAIAPSFMAVTPPVMAAIVCMAMVGVAAMIVIVLRHRWCHEQGARRCGDGKWKEQLMPGDF
jgi:hypothetical protein